MKHPALFDVWGVLELMPDTLDYRYLWNLFNKSYPVTSTAPMTILILPHMEPKRFSAERWEKFVQDAEGRFAGQYCLKTADHLPSIKAFAGPRGSLHGNERVHWFAHHSVDLLNEAGTAIIDGCGARVSERLFSYGKASIGVVYFGELKDREQFHCLMRQYWLNFNEYLEGRAELLRTPFPTDRECTCTKAAS